MTLKSAAVSSDGSAINICYGCYIEIGNALKTRGLEARKLAGWIVAQIASLRLHVIWRLPAHLHLTTICDDGGR